MKLLLKAIVGFAAALSVSNALAIPIEIGLATDVTVLPGSTYEISFEVRNSGASAMDFAYPEEFGLWTVNSAGLSNRGGDWNLLRGNFDPNFFSQFNGVTIGAGESQLFKLYTLLIPDLAVGSVAKAGVNVQFSLPFSADPLDTFYGGTFLGGTNLPSFDNRHELTLTIGDEFSSSSPTYNEACVVDRRDGSALSGGCQSVSVPEPGSLALLGLGLAGLGLARRKRSS